MDSLGKIFHVKLLGYAYWFMSIRISKMMGHSISVDQAIYATSILDKYLETVTVKKRTKFYNPLFHLILSSPRMMNITVMSKLRSWLGNSTFTTDIVLDH